MDELEALRAEKARRKDAELVEQLKAELRRRKLIDHIRAVYPSDWEERAAVLQSTVLDNPWIPDTYKLHPDDPKKDGLTKKQAEFLVYDGRECLFGGAAGGGKSVAALMAAAQYVTMPGYNALILRRNYQQLAMAESILSLSKSWWHGKVAWNGETRTWTFPSGATIKFGHMENPDSHLNYQGSIFHYCVGKGTPVLMADGSYRPIESLAVGDLVTTLEGPRRVTRTHRVPPKKAVLLRAVRGGRVVAEQVQSEDHRLLTTSGWASFDTCGESLLCETSSPTGHRSARKSGESSRPTCRTWPSGLSVSPSDLVRTSAPSQSSPGRQSWWENAACAGSRVPGIGYVESPCVRRGEPPHPLANDLPSPQTPDRRLSWPDAPLATGGRASGCDPCRPSPEDCRGDCSAGSRQCGGRVLPVAEGVRSCLRPQAGVGPQSPMCSEGDGLDRTQRCNRRTEAWPHPYTMGVRRTDAALDSVVFSARQIGVACLYDITVEGASHYITRGGLVNANCGFDELTQFPLEAQYSFLFTRQRRPVGFNIPIRMRATSNPGGPGHDWCFKRFIDPKTCRDGAHFIPAKLDDNRNLDRDDYIASMDKVDQITRAQMLEGDWNAVKGGRFLKEWFRYYRKDDEGFLCITDNTGATVERFLPFGRPRWQTCDPAAGTSDASDHFVISTWCLSPNANLIWLDCHRSKYEIPEQVSTAQRLYRRWQPQFITVEEVLNQKALAQMLRRSTDPPMVVRSVSPLGKNKLERATPSLVFAASGRLFLPEDNRAFPLEDVEGELIRFTGEAGNPDDVCDSLFYSVQALGWVSPHAGGSAELKPAYSIPTSAPDRERERRARLFGPSGHVPTYRPK